MIQYRLLDDRIKYKYTTWKTERDKWVIRALKSEGYYYNDVDDTETNYDQEQIKKIENSTNIPVSINYLHPTTNQKLALLVRNKPSHKVISVNGDEKGKKFAFVLDKMKHGVMYNSEANVQLEESCKDMLIVGQGTEMVVESDFFTPGEFETSIRYEHYSNIILDANCRDKTMHAAEGMFYEKELTYETAEQLYGEIIKAINATREPHEQISLRDFSRSTVHGQTSVPRTAVTGSPSASGDTGVVVVRQFFEPFISTMYLVEDPETKDVIRVFKENIPNDQQFILSNPLAKERNRFVRKYTILGDYIIDVSTKVYKSLPAKTTFFEWGGKPYRSYGMIHFTKGMQEAFDKIIQLMLLNGILSNNAGWTAPKDSIAPEDKAKWENKGNDPRVIKEFIPRVFEGGVVMKPEREQVQQLSNFYPMVLEMMKSGIEYSSGINGVIQGNPKEAGVDVFSSLQMYQNAAMERVILSLSHINQQQEALGRVVIDSILGNIRPETNYAFFDDKGTLNEIKIAKEMMKEIKVGEYIVRSIPAEAMPSQRMAIGTELMKIAQTTPDPSERNLFINKAIKLADIREADDLLEELDVAKNLTAKVESMQKELDRSAEIQKQMENRVINAEVKVKIYEKLMSATEGIVRAEEKVKNELDNQLPEPAAK